MFEKIWDFIGKIICTVMLLLFLIVPLAVGFVSICAIVTAFGWLIG